MRLLSDFMGYGAKEADAHAPVLPFLKLASLPLNNSTEWSEIKQQMQFFSLME